MDDIQWVIKEKPKHVVKSKADKVNAGSALDYGLQFVSITHSPCCSLVFESLVWSGFLTPQGLNRSALFPEVKKTRPDRKKTTDHSLRPVF